MAGTQQRLHVRRGDTVQIVAGSSRGVRGRILRTLPAKGKVEFAVVDTGAPVAPPETPLKVTEENGVVTVVTGFVKFRVRGTKFNGFDGAWFDCGPPLFSGSDSPSRSAPVNRSSSNQHEFTASPSSFNFVGVTQY